MFKNYLTHSFVVRFHQSCILLDIPRHVKIRLTKSAEQVLEKFNQSIKTDDQKREAAFLCAALMSLRDCREILDHHGVHIKELDKDWTLLDRRIEDLCLKAAAVEGGQLRMFA